jgi:hypothetical protein
VLQPLEYILRKLRGFFRSVTSAFEKDEGQKHGFRFMNYYKVCSTKLHRSLTIVNAAFFGQAVGPGRYGSGFSQVDVAGSLLTHHLKENVYSDAQFLHFVYTRFW